MTSDNSYGEIVKGITNILTIIPTTSRASAKVVFSTSYSSANTYLGGVFYLPGFANFPDINQFNGSWALYYPSQYQNYNPKDNPNVFTDALSFLSQNLTAAQAFYSKAEFGVGCHGYYNYGMYDYIFYPLITANPQVKPAVINEKRSSVFWNLQYFSSSKKSDIAHDFQATLSNLPFAAAFCSQLALDAIPCSKQVSFGAMLMPIGLTNIPNTSSLSPLWNNKVFVSDSHNATLMLKSFLATANLTDAQLCYSRMAFAPLILYVYDNNASTILSFWYPQLMDDHTEFIGDVVTHTANLV